LIALLSGVLAMGVRVVIEYTGDSDDESISAAKIEIYKRQDDIDGFVLGMMIGQALNAVGSHILHGDVLGGISGVLTEEQLLPST
jgi:hypothetical protein